MVKNENALCSCKAPHEECDPCMLPTCINTNKILRTLTVITLSYVVSILRIDKGIREIGSQPHVWGWKECRKIQTSKLRRTGGWATRVKLRDLALHVEGPLISQASPRIITPVSHFSLLLFSIHPNPPLCLSDCFAVNNLFVSLFFLYFLEKKKKPGKVTMLTYLVVCQAITEHWSSYSIFQRKRWQEEHSWESLCTWKAFERTFVMQLWRPYLFV